MVGDPLTKATFGGRAAHVGKSRCSGEIAKCEFMDLHTVVESRISQSHRQARQRLERQNPATWTNEIGKDSSMAARVCTDIDHCGTGGNEAAVTAFKDLFVVRHDPVATVEPCHQSCVALKVTAIVS